MLVENVDKTAVLNSIFSSSSRFSHLPTKQTLWGNLSQHCLALPENGFTVLSLKNLQKTEKCIFQTHTLVVSSFRKLQKPFSKKLLMIKF